MEVQCEQLSRELARHREQLEREAQALKQRLAEAREEGRTEARKHKEELAHTVNIHLLCVWRTFVPVFHFSLQFCLFCYP